MAGHSKWSNIKRRKGAADAKRGAIFTKLGREIQVAVREGGPDPELNNRLRDAVDRAKANNMPNDSIKRSIEKAAGLQDRSSFEEVQYEGYGPSGVAIIVKTLTDNRNRTAGDVRHAFDKHGGNLGTNGCVAYLFNEQGQIYLDNEEGNIDEDELFLVALEAGASDVEKLSEEAYLVSSEPRVYNELRTALTQAGYVIADGGVEPVSLNQVPVDAKTREQMDKLLEQLEESMDVQDVYHNMEDE